MDKQLCRIQKLEIFYIIFILHLPLLNSDIFDSFRKLHNGVYKYKTQSLPIFNAGLLQTYEHIFGCFFTFLHFHVRFVFERLNRSFARQPNHSRESQKYLRNPLDNDVWSEVNLWN